MVITPARQVADTEGVNTYNRAVLLFTCFNFTDVNILMHKNTQNICCYHISEVYYNLLCISCRIYQAIIHFQVVLYLFDNFTGKLIIGLMFSFSFIPVLMEMEWWRGAAPQQCPPAPGTGKDQAEPVQGGQAGAGMS